MAKRVLDMLIWHPEKNIKKCTIIIKHRGSPGNLKKIHGSMIKSLEGGFMILEDETKIPCQRIMQIKCDDEVVWGEETKR
ncbi:MAG TPA: RNA repair domain-containing protein [Methanobacteriaceae archaeon]|nr:RNA repair domain-containing protein [Methanobacteriaceae archaeon]